MNNVRAVRSAVLLDPHPLCHTAIAGLLARFDIEVVGATTSAGAAYALLQEHKPDLLVAELDLPEGRDEALRVLALGRRADPGLSVIVLSSTDDSGLIDAAFERGASAYVLKTSEPDVIATAVRQAFEPSLYFARPSEQRAATAPVELLEPKLTRRELEILKLVSEGRSNRQVAELLWVTDQTVKFHLANVYRKLGVRSRFDAARWALEHGVLDAAAEEVPAHAEHGNGKTTNVISLRRPSRPSLAPRGQLEETSR
jgi:DNA-binding NarL/FixJ family response regulator